eukprot:TRINITY_DN8311_c0_g1_i1.p1 TRINITY_DN8311_c0_g1~~TRINITY_DN8311_c0_g1_i1.p1  ORF type:complete len:719 (-),score=87.58 TRINITY_DN8311_c0_g1_i1:41-2197(-)
MTTVCRGPLHGDCSVPPLREFSWQLSRLRMRMFYVLFAVFSIFFGLQTTIPTLLVIAGSTSISLLGLISTVPKTYPRSAECLNLLVLMAAIAYAHVQVFHTPNMMTRQRSAAIVLIAWKHIPAFFGLLRCASSCILVWSFSLDVVNLYCMAHYYADAFSVGVIINAFMWFLIYLGASCIHYSWLVGFHSARQDVLAESNAMHSMLSILCEFNVQLDGDCDTVLRSHPVFDEMAGKTMESRRLSEELMMSADETIGLQDACARSLESPLLFPTTMGKLSSVHVGKELVVVKCSMCGRKNTSFLVGVRGGLDLEKTHEPADKPDLLAIEALAPPSYENWSQIEDDGDSDEGSEQRTTKTGKQFESLSTALKIGDRSMAKLCLQQISIIGAAEKWLVPNSDMQLHPDGILGRGGFGMVVRGAIFGAEVAVKMRLAKDTSSLNELPSLLNEIRIMRRLHHPNVLQFHGACLDMESMDVSLIFEMVHGVDLNRFVCGPPQTEGDASDRCCLLSDVASALRYLHAQTPPIVHGDLKSSNVMVENRGWGERSRPLAKLLDFGLARMATRNASANGGSIRWLAPEVLCNPKIVIKPNSDVFSFGRLIYFLVSGIEPHSGLSRGEILYQVRLAVSTALEWPGGDMFFPEDMTPLVERCVSLVPPSRPSMIEIHTTILAWKVQLTHDVDGDAKMVSWIDGLRQLRTQKDNLARTAAPEEIGAPECLRL